LGTIEENVLFGLKRDVDLYAKALKFSCLDQDIASMTLGDQTQIEEGALNLSGGQRTRICLARAIYADRPILLLDDPLSSLDLRVIHKVVENLSILSKSEGKTIILATHHVNSLAVCDKCIEMSNG
jgi:ABC-type multidrug transport system fused ATPase/permease subunit